MSLSRRLALCALAALAWAAPAAAQPASAPSAGDGAQATGPVRVRLAPFQSVAIAPRREATAVVVPRNESRIAAEVGGTVLRWGPDTGAGVARGALLVEIDPTDLRLTRDRAQAALAAAKARADLARAQLQRARELVAQGFLSQEALAARETELALAEADAAAQTLALASADRALAKARVTAPFDAAVRQRLVQAGETVAPGAPMYVLVQTEGAEVSAQLSPEDAESLRQATERQFVRPDGQATPLALARVAKTLNSPARTVEVRLTAQCAVPGRDGRLVWVGPRPHVPAALLVRRGGRLGVFSVQDGRARFVPVPGAQEGRAAPAALLPDMPVVTEGQQALRDGSRVAR